MHDVAQIESAGGPQYYSNKHGDRERSADNRAGWYILRCGGGLEFPARDALVNSGWDVFLPIERKWSISLWRRTPKRAEAEYPRFPGYLLAYIEPPHWPPLNSWPLDGLLYGILGMGGQPVPVAPGEVERLRGEDGAMVPHAGSVPVHRAFAVGQDVRVIAGPFLDFIARLDALDEAGAHTTVQIFGRPAEIALPLTWIEAA